MLITLLCVIVISLSGITVCVCVCGGGGGVTKNPRGSKLIESLIR